MLYPEYFYEFKCIEKALNTDRNLKLLVGLVALGCSIGLGYWVFQDFAWVWLVLAILILVGAVRLLLDVIQFWKPDSAPLMQLLQYQPSKLVWVYYEVTQKLPFGLEFSHQATIYFFHIEKDCLTIKINETDAKAVYECLKELLPHATFGYSKEKEQWYLANPALLLRE